MFSLAVNENSTATKKLMYDARQETIKSASHTLNHIDTAQAEEGAGLAEPLQSFTERHMARLVLAHIIGHRGFTLTDSILLNTFMRIARDHQPSKAVLQHPAFSSGIFEPEAAPLLTG